MFTCRRRRRAPFLLRPSGPTGSATWSFIALIPEWWRNGAGYRMLITAVRLSAARSSFTLSAWAWKKTLVRYGNNRLIGPQFLEINVVLLQFLHRLLVRNRRIGSHRRHIDSPSTRCRTFIYNLVHSCGHVTNRLELVLIPEALLSVPESDSPGWQVRRIQSFSWHQHPAPHSPRVRSSSTHSGLMGTTQLAASFQLLRCMFTYRCWNPLEPVQNQQDDGRRTSSERVCSRPSTDPLLSSFRLHRETKRHVGLILVPVNWISDEWLVDLCHLIFDWWTDGERIKQQWIITNVHGEVHLINE